MCTVAAKRIKTIVTRAALSTRIRLAFVHFQRTALTFKTSTTTIAEERIQPVFTVSIGARVRVAVVDVVTTVDARVAWRTAT